MKQKPSQNRSTLAGRFSRLLGAVTLSFMALAPRPGYAQTVNSASFRVAGYDTRNYSVDVLPASAQNRQSVMAGTVFLNNTSNGQIHFMKCNDGPTLAVLYPAVTASRVYTDSDPDYVDERVVSINSRKGTSGRYFITALSRMNTASASTTHIYNDRIKIMEVDDAGAILNERKFYENSITPSGAGTVGYSMYPLNAMYNPAVPRPISLGGGTRDLLYVCGYITRDRTVLDPAQPDFNTNKYIFIMAIDVTTATWTVVSSMFWDNALAFPTQTNNSPEIDADMAMRMQLISGTHPSYPGYIFISGSTTVKSDPFSNGPPNAPLTCVRSGSLALIVHPWGVGSTAGGTPFLIDNSFVTPSSGNGQGLSEYSVGMAEGTSVTGDDKYIVSNIYTGSISNCSGVPSNSWGYNPLGYNEHVVGATIAKASNSFVVNPAYSRLYYNDIVANTIMPTSAPSTSGATYTDGAQFLIAGIGPRTPWNGSVLSACPFLINATDNNLQPFLWDVEVGLYTRTGSSGPTTQLEEVGTTFTTLNYYSYPNATGTGTAGLPNSYAQLGGGLSFFGWGQTIASRLNSTSDIIFNAPKWFSNPTTGVNILGFKNFFAIGNATLFPLDLYKCSDATGNAYNRDCNPGKCNPYAQYLPASGTSGQIETANITDIKSTTTSVARNPVLTGTCTSTPPVYKTGSTGVDPLQHVVQQVSVIPNPATDKVQVAISGYKADGRAEVALYNMFGQLISTLYKGDVAALATASLQLPNVASGMYIVNINIDGAQVHKQKLTIQQ